MSKQKEVDHQIESIDAMVHALEESEDPALRAKVRELVQSLMALHGAAFERILEIAGQAGAPGKVLIDNFASDELVRSLLFLYGLHPVPLETRVKQALEKTRPSLNSDGAKAELLSLDAEGVATVHLSGTVGGCGASPESLKLAVEQAIYEAAPDVNGIVMQDSLKEKVTGNGFIPVNSLLGTSLRGKQPLNGNSLQENGHGANAVEIPMNQGSFK